MNHKYPPLLRADFYEFLKLTMLTMPPAGSFGLHRRYVTMIRAIAIEELRGAPHDLSSLSCALGDVRQTTTRRINYLKGRGFISTEREGARVTLRLDPDYRVKAMPEVQKMIDACVDLADRLKPYR